jgi:replicative DNA helicase
MQHLRDKQRPIDAVTVGEFLEKRGLGEQVSGGAYLIELASTTPSAANIAAYAQIVADKAQLRRVIEIGTSMVNAASIAGRTRKRRDHRRGSDDVAALLRSQPAEVSPMSTAHGCGVRDCQERNDRGEGMDGLPTGFTDFDEILGGLVPGVHFLGGRPKHGKSTLAQNIAEYVALVLKQAGAHRHPGDVGEGSTPNA